MVLPVLRQVRRRLIWMACRAPGNSSLFTVATLIRRISQRPWPVSFARPRSGMSRRGSDLSCLRRLFWLPLTITT
ncbi:hypothetical protein PL81_36970 [Streptomyces sp. RSD-27]|nr:hypothetical protein PL81_36970 [Streptomyces sp. RSD-27]